METKIKPVSSKFFTTFKGFREEQKEEVKKPYFLDKYYIGWKFNNR